MIDSMNFSFDNIFNQTKHDQKLDSAISYLDTLQNSKKQILDDESAYKALFYIGKTVQFTDVNVFSKKNCEKIFSHVLQELFKINKKLDFKKFTIDTTDQCRADLTKNDRRISIFAFLLYTTNKIIHKSIEFSINLAKQGGLKAFVQFLSCDSFVKNALNVTVDDFSLKKPFGLLDYLILNMAAMSVDYEENLDKWNEFDTVDILLTVAKIKQSTEFNAFVAVVNISNDKQIESLQEIRSFSLRLCVLLKECSEHFKEKRFNRQKRQFVDASGLIKDYWVHCELINLEFSVTLKVILEGLYRLSINDTMRQHIYFENNLKDSLKSVLYNANEVELNFALRLAAQLTFNKKIAQEFKSDLDLNNFIEQKLSSENSDQGVKEICSNMKWNMQVERTIGNAATSNHIMISYNSMSRSICLNIKSKLEALGHKVWIDVNDIRGSSLDSMAKAVENSWCVIICITEKYRQSINCQSEAQYAFKLNKKIVPLIMESGYENVKGWLGLIIGDKIFVNFTKYEFEECIRRLKHELDIKDLNTRLDIEQSTHIVDLKKSVLHWTADEVFEWFVEQKIDENLRKALCPCNGIILEQLYTIRLDAPEFYFQALNKYGVDLKAIILFTYNLKKLFEK